MTQRASTKGGVTKEGAEKRMRAAAKLTDQEVRTIRGEYPRMGKMVLADRFGVGPVTIMKIVRKESYRWVGEEGGPDRETGPSVTMRAGMLSLAEQLKAEGLVQVVDEEPEIGAKAGPVIEWGDGE